MSNNLISKQYRSFSGADTLVFALLPESKPIILGTLTTISYSMFRDKKPVPLIGRVNVGGFTRGTRIYAGTMIFTLVNQHWVNDLIEQLPWLKQYGVIKADELPLFDLMIVSANEYGATVQMFIYGVDVTDEGQVVSIEDILTENTFSFVARDLTNFSSEMMIKNDNFKTENTINTISNFDIEYNRELNPKNLISKRIPLERNLKYDSSNVITGKDVLEIQTLLTNNGINTPLTGIYDGITFDAVKAFQSEHKLDPTGAIDDKTYLVLMGDKNDDPQSSTMIAKGVVINKSGATVYANKLYQIPLKKYPYKSVVDILDSDEKWYSTKDGVVSSYDIYTYKNNNTTISFPDIRQGDSGYYVTMLQSALNEMYKNKSITTQVTEDGFMDYNTEFAVKEAQKSLALPVTGIVDRNTWLAIQSVTNLQIQTLKDGLQVGYLATPGNIDLNYNDALSAIDKYGATYTTSQKPYTIKVTAIAVYNDNKTEEFAKTILLSQNDTKRITLDTISDSLLYNPAHSSQPKEIVFVTYPVGGSASRWHFKFV